jgi:predicted nucleic acid-binding protein
VIQGEELTVVLADTSVVINFAHIDRLSLFGALRGYRFRIPEEVAEEVRRPEQRSLLQQALDAGYLGEVRLTGVATLHSFNALRKILGPGEAACLALAAGNGWSVACDERGACRREALRLIGHDRLFTTPDLLALAIRQGLWTVDEADQAKQALEQNRFRMRFGSLDEFMRRKGS